MAIGVAFAAVGGVLVFVGRLEGRPASTTLVGALGLIGLGLGLAIFGLGLGLGVIVPGLRGGAAARRGLGTHRLVVSCTVLVIVLSNLGPIVFSLASPTQGLCSVPGFLSAALSVALALMGITYLRFIRPGLITAEHLGIKPGSLLAHLGTGLLVGLMALIASAVMQLALDRLGVRQTQVQDFRCIKAFPAVGFFAVLLAGGVLAPIAEELYFRGFVFRTYLVTRGPLAAYLLSSALFAVLHLNLPAMLPIFLLGVLFCFAYQRTGSIVPSMVGHALNNSVAFAILYFGEVGG